MKFKLKRLIISMFLIMSVSARAEEISIITRFPNGSVGHQVGFQFVKRLNSIQDRYNFTLRSIPGALGETADQRVLTLGRSGTKVVWFGPVTSFTLNRFEIGNTYDRDNDFFFIRSLQSTYQSLVVSKTSNIKTVAELVDHIRNKPKAFYGAQLEVGATKFLSNIFTRQFKINNVEMIKYKDIGEIVIALNNREIDYSIFIRPAVTDILTEIANTKPDQNSIPLFVFETLSVFAVPKEIVSFGESLIPTFMSLCKDKEILELMTRIQYNETCYDNVSIRKRIKDEVEIAKEFQ